MLPERLHLSTAWPGFFAPLPAPTHKEAGLERLRAAALRYSIAPVMDMQREAVTGLHYVALVIARDSVVGGYQVKHQIPLEGEP